MPEKIPARLFVVEPRGSGGMIHYAYQMCNALSGYFTEVTLVTARRYELEGYPHQFRVVRLMHLWTRNVHKAQRQTVLTRFWWIVFRNIRRAGRGLRYSLEWVRLVGYLLREKPDIVQFGAVEFAMDALFLRFLRSRGLVLTQVCHEFEARENSTRLMAKLHNALLKNVFSSFEVMFFHSRSNLERFHELYPEIPRDRFRVIAMGNGQLFPQAADPERSRQAMMQRYALADTDKVVLFFGNLTPSKGIPDLLEAFAGVRQQDPRARLIIAGMPLKYINFNALFDQATRLGIQPATCFDTRYIPIEEVNSLLSLATVVVFPYLSSTQSASIQAAYAAGRPVIATRVGGLPDVVEDGKSGFLVEPGVPNQLESAIMKIINTPGLAEQMGRTAIEYSHNRFAWEPIAGDIAAVYRGVLQKRGKENDSMPPQRVTK